MSYKQRILIVDDEPQLLRVLRRSLTARGYDVHVATDGNSALQASSELSPDLVIVDLSMPKTDGLEFCQKLRAISPLPIIALSNRGDERTKVKALDAGTDDYVTKPFGMGELLARVRAVLRRAPIYKSDYEVSRVLEVGDFRLDLECWCVTVKGRQVRLTPKEYDLMVYLISHPGKVLTHRTLLTAIWGTESVEQMAYLRVFVGQLRKKIEPDPATPRYILTDPWIGYRFDPNS